MLWSSVVLVPQSIPAFFNFPLSDLHAPSFTEYARLDRITNPLLSSAICLLTALIDARFGIRLIAVTCLLKF